MINVLNEEPAALLNFPECDGRPWTDTFEGGQYVLLVVPEPDDQYHNCHIDVGTFLRLPKPQNRVDTVMTYPDVCHTPNDLWTEDGYLDGFKESGEAYRRFLYSGDEDLARWALSSCPAGLLSKPVLATVLLGSSSQSRYSDEHGHYWTASYADLTFRGRLIFDTLKSLYGTKPLLLTFLDT